MISDEDREKLRQVEQRSAFLLNGESAWTAVYQLSEGGAAYFSALTPVAMRDDVLATTDWDLHYDQGVPGFSVSGGAEPAVSYLRFGNHDGVEPLIITQEHYRMRPEMLPQLSEEFRLYHNLWMSPDGKQAVKIENDGTSGSASETAAVAEARNPANVMPIWIVARNLVGLRASRTSRRPPAPPSRSSCLSWLSRKETRAISLPANTALTRTRTSTSSTSVV